MRTNPLWERWGLPLAFAFVFCLLGGLYSVTTPLFEASDELWHYPYAKYMADGHGLPVQPGGGEYEWRQEGSQPPLYYALAAAVTFWIDTGPPDEVWQANPHARTGVALAPDNKNMVLHQPFEGFPYEGVELAVRIIRFLTVLMGAVAVALTYMIARQLAPDRKYLAIGATALVAFNPMYIFTSASVDNDALVVALSSLALFLIIRVLRGGTGWMMLAVLGATLGLAALTKLSGLILFPLAALVLIVVARRERSWARLIGGGTLVFGLALVIAGWWYYRNFDLYGDPTGLNAMLAVAGERDVIPGILELLPEAQGLFISYWALFGGSNVLASPFIYDVLAVFTGLAFLGFIIFLARPKARADMPRGSLVLGLLGGHVGLLFISLIRWTQLTLASLGRLLFPGISALSIFLVLGLLTLLPRRAATWAVSILTVSLFLFSLISPFAYILPAYPEPDLLTTEELDERQYETYINFDGKADLIGYSLSAERLRRGDTLKLDLYWRALEPMERDYSVFVHLFGKNGQDVGQTDSYPGMGSYPTSRWRSGDLLRDSYWIPIAEDAEVPSQLWVEAGLYDYGSFEGLTSFDLEGREVSPKLVRLKLIPDEPLSPNPEHAVGKNLGGKVTLLGYDLDPDVIRPGEQLSVNLYWRAEDRLQRDYTVFVHLVGPGETTTRRAQSDTMPSQGNYPTSLWDVGEVVVDEHRIMIDSEAPPGTYRLLAGMYYLETMDHLVSNIGETAIVIGEVQVGQ